jgi:AraC-like DNA-binding protein
MELVRATTLSGYFEIARELGIDCNPQLRRVGLTRSMLAHQEQMIPSRAVIDLLEASAIASNCPTFALRMVERRSLADIGRISLLIAHQTTLREALDVLSQYRNRINPTLALRIEHAGEIVILREDFLLRSGKAGRQANDLALGVLARTCGTVLESQWQPEQVCFSYAAPPIGDREIYRRVFGCPVVFDNEFNGIILDARDLDRENPHADLALAFHARSLLETVMDTGERTIIQEVEQAILLLLPAGRASIKGCADALGMNLRTMQRKLDQSGTSFSAILEEMRVQLVRRYFSSPKLRLTDIADLLGYRSLGAFSHWYTGKFGETPMRARRKP